MPAKITGNATARLKRLQVQVSNVGLYELALELGQAMLEELMAVPWEGNIKRGLMVMRPPRQTTTGGWIVGLGSLDILGRPGEKAPPHTIHDFLQWYRNVFMKREEMARERAGVERAKVEAARKAELAAGRARRREIGRLEKAEAKAWGRFDWFTKRAQAKRGKITELRRKITRRKAILTPASLRMQERWEGQIRELQTEAQNLERQAHKEHIRMTKIGRRLDRAGAD